MLFPIEFAPVITILSILLVGCLTITGYKSGFVLKGMELLSTVICALIAWIISMNLIDKIDFLPEYTLFQNELLNQSMTLFVNRIIIFILLFLVLRILIIFIRPLFKSINWIPFVGFVNKILGAVLGYIEAYVLLVIFSFILTTPLFINGQEILKESKLIYVKDVFQKTSLIFNDEFDMLDSVQKMFVSTDMEDKDYENITHWLKGQGFNANEINEVIILLKQRSE